MSGDYIEPDAGFSHTYRCDGQTFETVDASIFAKPENVQVLYLFDCGVKKIAPNTFAVLRNLKRLHIELNELTEIDENFFAGLNELRFLRLHSKSITRIDFNAFRLPPLVNIKLNIGALDEIDLATIASIPNLLFITFDSPVNNLIFSNNVNVDSNLKILTFNRMISVNMNDVLNHMRIFKNLEKFSLNLSDTSIRINVKSILDIFPKMKHFIINGCYVRKLGKLFHNDSCLFR